MERRVQTRVTPVKPVLAILTGIKRPADVVDYSTSGIKVSAVNRLKPGNKVLVDLIVNEELCACCVPGIVRWSRNTSAGICLEHANEHQVHGCHKVEMRIMH